MQQSKAKTWLIVVAIFLSLLALMFMPLVLIYSLPLLVAGVFYDSGRSGFWSGLVLASPFVLGVSAWFSIRLYFAVAHGGEAPNGDGSPLAFLMGFALEMPFYILLLCLLIAWVRDFRRYRANAAAELTGEQS